MLYVLSPGTARAHPSRPAGLRNAGRNLDRMMHFGSRFVGNECAGAQCTQYEIGFFAGSEPKPDTEIAIEISDFIKQFSMEEQLERRHRNIAKALRAFPGKMRSHIGWQAFFHPLHGRPG